MLYRDRAGIGRYVWELQRAIADLDVDSARLVDLLLDPRDREHSRAALRARRVAVPARHAFESAVLPLRLQGYNVVHFPDHALPAAVGVPSVVTVHDVSFLTCPHAHHTRSVEFYRTAMKRLGRAAHVITVSGHVRNLLLERRLAIPDRVSVIPEGPATMPEAVGGSVPSAAPYALMVGTVQPRKNYVHAATAWLQTRAASEMLLLVVGEAGYRGGEIIRRIRMLDPNGRVRFLGRVPDSALARLYAHATVLLQSSLDEGFGLPVLEAMGAGVPCVVSDIGALRELAGGSAIFVNTQDTEAFASSVDQVVSNRQLQGKLQEAGRKQAAQYSWSRAAQDTLAVYERFA
jgi:glycosyltransferase involved in cell wall biosynthesis